MRLPRLEQQFGQRNHGCDGGKLHHLQRIGNQIRQHIAHGLRQHNEAHGLGGGQPRTARGFHLTAGDAFNAGAQNLAVIGTRVQEKPNRHRAPGADFQAQKRQAGEDENQQHQGRQGAECIYPNPERPFDER